MGKVCHVCGVPPSLCFAIKRDMGLLPATKNRILAMDDEGATKGVAAVDAAAPRRLKAASPGPVRSARRAAPAPRGDDGPA